MSEKVELELSEEEQVLYDWVLDKGLVGDSIELFANPDVVRLSVKLWGWIGESYHPFCEVISQWPTKLRTFHEEKNIGRHLVIHPLQKQGIIRRSDAFAAYNTTFKWYTWDAVPLKDIVGLKKDGPQRDVPSNS